MTSDRRLKDRLRRIGATAAGVPIYAFHYIGDAVRHVGVMAQDVLRVAPDAVFKMPNGFYAVDYSRVP